MRIAGPLLLAVLVVLGLFALMQWMITAPESDAPPSIEVPDIAVVPAEPPKDSPEEQDELPAPDAAPPPPGSPPPLQRPDMPAIAVSMPALGDTEISLPVSIAGGGGTLTGRGFGGFATGSGRGSGGSGGGGGYGRGQGFKGKELVPLSTARPQIPEYAYRRGIEGWVEVVFTVMPNGRVRDIKIIDAYPRGVFETAALDGVANWIYEEHDRAREVKQRVEFKLADFQFNWQ